MTVTATAKAAASATDDAQSLEALDPNTLVGKFNIFSGEKGTSCKLQLFAGRIAYDPKSNDDWRQRSFVHPANPVGKKLSFYTVPAAVGHAEIATGFMYGRFKCGTFPPISPPTNFVPELGGAEYKLNLAGSAMGMSKDGRLDFAKIFKEAVTQPKWVRKMLDIELTVLHIMFVTETCSVTGKVDAYRRAVDVIARQTPEWRDLVHTARAKVENAIKAKLKSDKEFDAEFTDVYFREYVAGSKPLFFIPRDHIIKNEDDVDCYEEFETGEIVPVTEMRNRKGTPRYWGVPVQTRCYTSAETFDASKQQKKDGAAAAAGTTTAGGADSGSHPAPSPAAKAAKHATDADASASASAASTAKAHKPAIKDEGPSRIRTNLGDLEVPGKVMKALPIKVTVYEVVKTMVDGKPKAVGTPIEVDVTSHPNTHEPIGRDLKPEHYEKAKKILERPGGAVVKGDIVDIAFIPEGFDGKKNYHMRLEMVSVRRLGEGPGESFTKAGPKGPANDMADAFASAFASDDVDGGDSTSVDVKCSDEYNEHVMQEEMLRVEQEHMSKKRKRDDDDDDADEVGAVVDSDETSTE